MGTKMANWTANEAFSPLHKVIGFIVDSFNFVKYHFLKISVYSENMEICIILEMLKNLAFPTETLRSLRINPTKQRG